LPVWFAIGGVSQGRSGVWHRGNGVGEDRVEFGTGEVEHSIADEEFGTGEAWSFAEEKSKLAGEKCSVALEIGSLEWQRRNLAQEKWRLAGEN
jgi:hypothetical protein